MQPCTDLPADLQEVIKFHGHLCPGIVIGYRAAKEALRRLAVDRAEDEELVAIVENDACGVDAVQVLTGCTFGKGNFFFRDYGKHVYTIARRSDGKAVRLSAKPKRRTGDEPESKDERSRRMLVVPLDELFEVQEVSPELPERASIHESIPCDACGEPTMATRVRNVGGRRLCIPCSET
jgi:formylmethanofuran dehydrogenase subunit E